MICTDHPKVQSTSEHSPRVLAAVPPQVLAAVPPRVLAAVPPQVLAPVPLQTGAERPVLRSTQVLGIAIVNGQGLAY